MLGRGEKLEQTEREEQLTGRPDGQLWTRRELPQNPRDGSDPENPALAADKRSLAVRGLADPSSQAVRRQGDKATREEP